MKNLESKNIKSIKYHSKENRKINRKVFIWKIANHLEYLLTRCHIKIFLIFLLWRRRRRAKKICKFLKYKNLLTKKNIFTSNFIISFICRFSEMTYISEYFGILR